MKLISLALKSLVTASHLSVYFLATQPQLANSERYDSYLSWTLDATYIPMDRGFVYLTTVVNVYCRHIWFVGFLLTCQS
jgi:hypothetical protein